MQNQENTTIHENNLLHFTAMVYMAQVDGELKNNARKVINKSNAMFTGKFDFESYDSFVKN